MKQVILILCIVIAVAGSIAFEQAFIKSTFSKLGEKIADCIEVEKHGAASDMVADAYGWWKEKKRLLHAVIPHNDIRELEAHFSLAKIYSTEENNIDALSELEALLDLSVSVPKTYRFSLENIL